MIHLTMYLDQRKPITKIYISTKSEFGLKMAKIRINIGIWKHFRLYLKKMDTAQAILHIWKWMLKAQNWYVLKTGWALAYSQMSNNLALNFTCKNLWLRKISRNGIEGWNNMLCNFTQNTTYKLYLFHQIPAWER